MTANGIDWTKIDWTLSNQSLSRLLAVRHETVSRMRNTYAAPSPRSGPGASRSGRQAPAAHHAAADAARRLIVELASGSPQQDTVDALRSALDVLGPLHAVTQLRAATGS